MLFQCVLRLSRGPFENMSYVVNLDDTANLEAEFNVSPTHGQLPQ